MEIRRARPEDAAAIAAVHVRSWQAAYEHVFGAERLAALDPEPRRVSGARWLAEPETDACGAVEDGAVVAFVSTGPSRDDPEEGELYAIYALPEAWGSGAGGALLDAAVDALRERGYPEAILWVLEDNPRPRRFYEREGWRADGHEREGEHLGVRTVEIRYRISL